MNDVTAYPDAAVARSIRQAKRRIDRFTGTTWGNIDAPAYDSFTVKVRPGDIHGGCIRLTDEDGRRLVYPRSVSAVDANGDAVSLGSGLHLGTIGIIYIGSNTPDVMTLTVTAGKENTPNDDIQWCARELCRHILVGEQAFTPPQALEQPGEFGPIKLATPGRRFPTGLPAVDAVLDDFIHVMPSVY